MKKFKAAALDLDMELTLLDGTVTELHPKIPLNANGVEMILKGWKSLENKYFDEAARVKARLKKRGEKLKAIEKGEDINEENEQVEDAGLLPFKLSASRLALVYDKPAAWFLENFFAETLTEITTYIIETITGSKKKSMNSNQSPGSVDSESE